MATAEYNQALIVTVHGARNLRKADITGSSDPWAKIDFPVKGAAIFGKELPPEFFRTPAVQKSLSPTWDRSVVILTKRNVEFIPVEVLDEDFGSGSDSLGHVNIQIDKTRPYTVIDNWYQINLKHNSDVHVSYVYVPLEAVQSLAQNSANMNAALQRAMADDAADDAKIANLMAQVQAMGMEMQQLRAYLGNMQAQMGAQESEKAALQARVEELTQQLNASKAAQQLAEQRASMPKNQLYILRARYHAMGNESHGADVTQEVRGSVTPDHMMLQMPVNNKVCEGDPCPGIQKQLTVWYKRNEAGPEEMMTTTEGGVMALAA